MNPVRPLIPSLLIGAAALLLGGAGVALTGPCRPLDIRVEKAYDENSMGTLAIDLKGVNLKEVSVNLIEPKGRKILDAKTLEFKNLERGEYIVVVTGRSMDSDYCPSYIKLSIE